MKKALIIFLALFSTLSWGCILIQGEIAINEEKLTVHQKVKVDESYPYRTKNFLIHMKVLKNNVAHIQIFHPKTLKVLIEKLVLLPMNKKTKSQALKESQEESIKLSSELILKNI